MVWFETQDRDGELPCTTGGGGVLGFPSGARPGATYPEKNRPPCLWAKQQLSQCPCAHGGGHVHPRPGPQPSRRHSFYHQALCRQPGAHPAKGRVREAKKMGNLVPWLGVKLGGLHLFFVEGLLSQSCCPPPGPSQPHRAVTEKWSSSQELGF